MNAFYAVVGMVAGGRQNIVATVAEGDPALIVPEPGNPFDPNALAVHTAPAGAMADSRRSVDGWEVGELDRRLLLDRQAGYVPAKVAAMLALPAEGIVGTVANVRLHPDTGVPAGFDVQADLPRKGEG